MIPLQPNFRKNISAKLLGPWVLALALALSVSAAAQDAVPPQTAGQTPTAEPAQKPSPSEQKPVQTPGVPEAKPTKPEPERKGGIQNAEATKAESAKGSTNNLGTDVVAVRQRIEAALSNDPTLRGSSFNLNVTDDTIEITGLANNGRDRTAARRIVQSFAGNMRVKDRITVPGSPAPSATPASATPDRSKTQADTEADALAKPESDEQTPQKKANKPKKDPAKHGDQAEEPRANRNF